MAQETYTDAIALLKADHRKVEDLFEQFEKAKGADRKRKLAERICLELKIHTRLEEEIFYPAFRGKIKDETLNEAYVEHDGAKILVNDIVRGASDDSFYDAKVKVLAEEIRHHVKEEERPATGMFAQCRNAGVDLVALRDQMLARKQELASKDVLPPAELLAVRTR